MGGKITGTEVVYIFPLEYNFPPNKKKMAPCSEKTLGQGKANLHAQRGWSVTDAHGREGVASSWHPR